MNRHARPRRYLQRVITRDWRTPLSDDDREMEQSWRMIPVPPTDDSSWVIIDDSKDHKTTWVRWIDLGNVDGSA